MVTICDNNGSVYRVHPSEGLIRWVLVDDKHKPNKYDISGIDGCFPWWNLQKEIGVDAKQHYFPVNLLIPKEAIKNQLIDDEEGIKKLFLKFNFRDNNALVTREYLYDYVGMTQRDKLRKKKADHPCSRGHVLYREKTVDINGVLRDRRSTVNKFCPECGKRLVKNK